MRAVENDGVSVLADNGRKVLRGILFVLYTGIRREFLPQELGFGSGMTCWRRAHGSGLGVCRWVVEGALALLHWFRRLRIRWEIPVLQRSSEPRVLGHSTPFLCYSGCLRIPWGGRLGRGNDDREREGIRRDDVAGLDFGPVR